MFISVQHLVAKV